MSKSRDSSSAKASLLTDSLSSDSDVVPDLELIPPSRPKKKLRFKRVAAKFAMPNEENEYANEYTLPRAWIACASLVLMSLVLGLAVTSWFTVTLYRELETILSNNSDTIHDLQRRLQALELSHDTVMMTKTTDELKSAQASLFPTATQDISEVRDNVKRLSESFLLLKTSLQKAEADWQQSHDAAFANFSTVQAVATLEHSVTAALAQLTDLKTVMSCTQAKCCALSAVQCSSSSGSSLPPRISDSGVAGIKAMAQSTETNGTTAAPASASN